MAAETTAIQDALPVGPRYALDVCAIALGASRGPILLRSSEPRWEYTLRGRVGNQLFMLDDPSRPRARPWVGAVWIEPRRQGWHDDLRAFADHLPGGTILSIVTSLPLAVLQQPVNPRALCLSPLGVWRLLNDLASYGFRVERAFGFHPPWWSALQWIATRIRGRRPDWSDRVQHMMRRRFVAPRLAVPLATAGLIQARAGMRP